MKTPAITALCPHCNQRFTARELRRHYCDKYQGGLIEIQDWFKAVDEALVAAGKPEMIYGFEVEYLRADGQIKKFQCAVSSEAAARRKAILKTLFHSVIQFTPYSYRQYCRCFGIPGSRM